MSDRALTTEELKPDATPGVQEATDDDFLFFRKHPNRLHRLRKASAAEGFEAAMAGMRIPDGEARFLVTRFFFEGGEPPIAARISLRAFLCLPADTDEETAKEIFGDLLAIRPKLAKAEIELEALACEARRSAELQRRAMLLLAEEATE